MSDRLAFYFEDEMLYARPGQSLAAALCDAHEPVFRHTAKGAPRGVFCGMGVCQDCLVSIDGVPNQRACMTLVAPGARVKRQDPRPQLTSPAAAVSVPGRTLCPDVLIIGAGAGGLSAAMTAARAGARVLVLDERKVAGGQYFKQPADRVPLLDTQQAQGADLLQEARNSGAEIVAGVETWGVFPGPLLYATAADGAALTLRPRQLIVAAGAYERPRMVPGWTLPGVMTTGAAQTLWRSYRSLPGRRIAVCGSGPLNLQVALELARGGAELLMVAESAPAPWAQPLKSLALLAAGPSLGLAGMGMLLGLRRAGVPVRYRSELQSVAAMPDGSLEACFRGAGGEERIQLDTLCMNDGFEPQNEILRLLGAEFRYDPDFGQLRCLRNDALRSSVENVYAIGDCCGLGGAPAALAEGRIAGAAAAMALGFTAEDQQGSHRALARARRFQRRLWACYRPAPRPISAADDETILCRCEEVTVGQFRASMAQGAQHIGSVKRATRVGMGCCQGRYCAPVAARMLAEANGGSLCDQSYFAPRVPIKPVTVAAVRAARETDDAAR